MEILDCSVSIRKAYRLLIAIALLTASTHSGAQWLDGYSHRFRITVDESLVPGINPLVGFPYLFSITDALLRSTSNGGFVYQPDGTDLCFADKDSAKVLDYEIVDYDPVTGSLSAFIRLPSLAALSDTEFDLYHGNPTGLPLWNKEGVWSNDYTAVWHLEDDPTEDEPQFKDATSWMNHGTKGGEILADDMVDGKISGGIRFNGVNAFATMPVAGFNTDSGTVALWINLDSLPQSSSDYFFAHRQEEPIGDRVYLRVWPDGKWGTGMGDTYDLVRGNTLDIGSWHHLAIAWNDSEVIGFLDGAQDYGPVAFAGLDTVREIYVMTWMPESESAMGTLDELRVSSINRDSAWIAASFLIQHQPESYYTVQSEFVNDFPCQAIELDIADSCTFSTYTNLGAGDSGIPDPGCSAYAGGDIWFYVVLPPDSAINIQTDTEAVARFPGNNGWMHRAGMALYEGACEALIPIDCYMNNSSYHPRMAGATLSGRNPGDTIWIRIWEASNDDIGKFKICVSSLEELPCPSVFTVSGGGFFCEGDTGMTVTLSGSEAGRRYTLILNDTIRLDTLAGDGEQLSWTSLQTEGIYRVEAEFPPDTCKAWMQDSAVIAMIGPIPYQVTGGGYCSGDVGAMISLGGSESGVMYTLVRSDSIHLDTIVGSGDTITWWPVQVPGTYKVIAHLPSDSCWSLMFDSAVVEVLSPPQLSFNAVSISCFEEDDGIISTTISGGTAPYELEWTGPEGFTSTEEGLFGLAPGVYSLSVTDSNQCAVMGPEISITEPELLVAAVDSIYHLTRYEEEDGSVDLSITGGTLPYTAFWAGTDDYISSEEDATGMTVGTYKVQVTDDHGCQDSVKMIVVSVREDAQEVFVPEGFSPNGDGYNDRFVILGIEAYPDNELVVFNKQGVEVYHSINYNNNWDGTPESGGVLGGVLPEGTYYYIFRFGKNGVKKGYLYLNKE